MQLGHNSSREEYRIFLPALDLSASLVDDSASPARDHPTLAAPALALIALVPSSAACRPDGTVDWQLLLNLKGADASGSTRWLFAIGAKRRAGTYPSGMDFCLQWLELVVSPYGRPEVALVLCSVRPITMEHARA